MEGQGNSQNISGRQRRERQTKVFDAPTGVAHCMFCPSRHLRLSRLRREDVPKILRFLFPVRCGRCGQRQYTSQLIATLAGRHQMMRQKERVKKTDPAWSEWTSPEAAKQGPSHIPITTMMGPKATRLTANDSETKNKTD